MVQINLLPQEYRKREPAYKKIGLADLNFLKNIPVMNIAIGFVAVLAVMHIALFFGGVYSKSTLASLSMKLESVMPEKRYAESLKTLIQLKDQKVRAIDELVDGRFSWAAKLNELSDSMTSGIWLSDFGYEERQKEKAPPPAGAKVKKDTTKPPESSVLKYLVLTGYASSLGGQGTALIGKFMSSLKDNASFYSDFQQIELVSMKSSKFDDQEVMNFKIACLFNSKE
ncbi:MAG: hypothetical protein WC592_01785 [Candidatus Omnitrophota bacterium]|nr:hypothetical protein [Candidatus Omnitrophota bacterium]